MLDFSKGRKYRDKGAGLNFASHLRRLGNDVVIEDGVRVLNPENVWLGDGVYLGHGVILEGYHDGEIRIGDGSWIGAFSFLHGAGRLLVGRGVGLGPRVTILTSQHDLGDAQRPVLHAPLIFAPVVVEDGADIGASATILPGVTIGEGSVVGAGSVVTHDVPPMAVVTGCPARFVKTRGA
jgi:acetyltransferase-like isoleucine patch superfamily enzyme